MEMERLSEVLEARRKREEVMRKVIEARNAQIDRMRVMIMVLGVVQVLMLAMVFVCPLC
jgi:hypothetical protein